MLKSLWSENAQPHSLPKNLAWKLVVLCIRFMCTQNSAPRPNNLGLGCLLEYGYAQ